MAVREDRGGQDDEFNYTPRARDRRNSPRARDRRNLSATTKDNSSRDEGLFPKESNRVRGVKEGPTTKSSQFRAALHLLGDIKDIFYGPIDPDRAMKFVEKQGRNCSAVLITDILSKLDFKVGDALVSTPGDVKLYVPVMVDLSKCFLVAEGNIGPRELSTCMRIMGRILSLQRGDGELAHLIKKLKEELEPIQGRLVSLWTKSLEYARNNMNISDCAAAIQGIFAGKDWTHDQLLASPEGSSNPIAAVLKETCDVLCEKIATNEEIPLVHLVTLLRHCAVESVVSYRLLNLCNEKLWAQDSNGKTIFDRYPGSHNYHLHLQISTLFATSIFGVVNNSQLHRIQRDLLDLQRLNQLGTVSTDMIGDFLASCIAHDHCPDDNLIAALEESLPSSIALEGRDPAATARASYYAVTSLMILKGSLQPYTLSLCKNLGGGGLGKASIGERVVGAALDELAAQWGFNVDKNFMYGPCEFDFLVTNTYSKDSSQVNIEVDGRPYHSVFDVDGQRISESVLPFKNKLRDQLAEQAGVYVVRIWGDNVDNKKPEDVQLLIEQLVFHHLGIDTKEAATSSGTHSGPA